MKILCRGLLSAVVVAASVTGLTVCETTGESAGLGELIGAHDENRRGFWPLCAKHPQSIHRVGRGPSRELEIAHTLMRQAVDGGADHFQSELGGCLWVRRLMGRELHWNPENLAQRTGFVKLPCQGEVTDMRRVEGAPENAEPDGTVLMEIRSTRPRHFRAAAARAPNPGRRRGVAPA